MSEPVRIERPAEGVVRVRLWRPERLNALNMALRRALARTFRALAEDEGVRAVVLAGTDKAFAAGADLSEMVDADSVEMMRRATHRLWQAVADAPMPVIAAVRGYALGGGLELAMHADIIIAAEEAQLGQPEVRVGIMPGAGGTQRLLRAVGPYRAAWLVMTGTRISGREAAAMGLVSRAVPDAQVEEEALEVARRIAALPPLALREIKEVLRLGADAPLPTALALERRAFQLLFSTHDQEEGMRAFLDKRKPRFEGR